MRSQGHAVESICRVLREQGCQIAARTYRAMRSGHRGFSARPVTDGQTVEAIRRAAWTTDAHGRRRLTPEGLYGRR
jgi:putative transposase